MKSKSFTSFLLTAGYFMFVVSTFAQTETSEGSKFQSIPLKSQITGVQPMTGIVLWEQLDNKDTDAIQMEY